MNIIEQIALFLGRIKGQYALGQKAPQFTSTEWSEPSLSDPSAWAHETLFGAGLSADGKPVSKQDALRFYNGWVYICSKANSMGVAATQGRVYVAKPTKGKKVLGFDTRPVEKRQLAHLASNRGLRPYLKAADEVEEIIDHPLVKLFESPNDYHTQGDLWFATTMFMDLMGEGYWYMPVNSLGIPKQLWVIPSQHITPKYGKTLDEAILYYEYASGGRKERIDPAEILSFPTPGPSHPLASHSIMQGLASEVYIASQMNAFEEALFKNRARVGGVVEQTERIAPQAKDRLKEQLAQDHTGSKQAGKTMFLPYGLKYTRDTLTPQELNFSQGRSDMAKVIISGFGQSEGMYSKDANRANIETAEYIHAKQGILPRCRIIEQHINKDLASRYDRKIFFAFDNPVPKDREAEREDNVAYVNAGVFTRDEIRTDLGKDARGGAADELLVDGRLTQIDQLGQAAQDAQAVQLAERAKVALKNMLGGRKDE